MARGSRFARQTLLNFLRVHGSHRFIHGFAFTMVTVAGVIADVVQTCNDKIVRLYSKDTCNVSNSSGGGSGGSGGGGGGASAADLETGCVVCINVNCQQLLRFLRVPSRRKMRPCVTAPRFKAIRVKNCSEPSFLVQAEIAISNMLLTNCSSCNQNKRLTVSTSTTAGGDQPLNKKSARYVYLNESTCVLQEGVYYGHYFVPERKGKLLRWFSSRATAAPPRHLSARVCCLLNGINSLTGDGNGIIKQFEVLTKPPSEDFIGPLGQKCVKQVELDEPGSVLMFITL